MLHTGWETFHPLNFVEPHNSICSERVLFVHYKRPMRKTLVAIDFVIVVGIVARGVQQVHHEISSNTHISQPIYMECFLSAFCSWLHTQKTCLHFHSLLDERSIHKLLIVYLEFFYADCNFGLRRPIFHWLRIVVGTGALQASTRGSHGSLDYCLA